MKKISAILVFILCIILGYQNCGSSGGSSGAAPVGFDKSSIAGKWQMVSYECNGQDFVISGMDTFMEFSGDLISVGYSLQNCKILHPDYKLVQDGDEFMILGNGLQCIPGACSGSFKLNGTSFDLRCPEDFQSGGGSSSYKSTFQLSGNLLKKSANISETVRCIETYIKM